LILVSSVIVLLGNFQNNFIPFSSFLHAEEEQLQQYSFTAKWDSKGSEDGQFKNPHSIDIDSVGNVYIADSGNNRIQKFSEDGKFITKWGSEGTRIGQFKGLHDVAIDPSGKFIYTLELGNNHRIQKFTSTGEFITKWTYENSGGVESYRDHHQIAIDSTGNLYLPDKGDSKVLKFDSNGNFITKWGSGGKGNSQFKTPHGAAIDSKDNVYVTDMDNFRIQKFDGNGKFIAMWGSEGSGEGQFSRVTPGIDIDPIFKEDMKLNKFYSTSVFPIMF